MKSLVILAYLAMLCFFTSGVHGQEIQKQQALKAYEAAVADPDSKAVFEAFLATLPRSRHPFTGETLYLLEGDLPRTARQVRAYLRARTKPPQETGLELKLHTVMGTPMCWRPELRTLHYAVWQPSFAALNDNGAYKKIVATARAAMDDWEKACPECDVKFVHVPELDKAASLDALLDAVQEDRIRFFIYYQKSEDETVLARAFFPGDPPESRNLEVNDAVIALLAATPPAGRLTARGVLRHELGHILGYRHEHMKSPNNNHCRRESGDAIDITKLDTVSVMHYDCGGAKPPGADDVISPNDVVGHSKVYGKQLPGHMCGVPVASGR